jgi:hypothetical protein
MANDLIIIQNLIYEVRGEKIMLDSDLARLYQVQTKVLNQAVKRNSERFPIDFMFQLTDEEWQNLRSQNVTFKKDIRKYKPYAFTEHGVLMLSNVLNSSQAIKTSILIIRVFNQLREYALTQKTTNKELEELKTMLMLHVDKSNNKFNQQDETLEQIISALNNLMAKPKEPKKIGF